MEGLFHLDKDIPQFKEHLRDFLVQIKVKLHKMNAITIVGLIDLPKRGQTLSLSMYVWFMVGQLWNANHCLVYDMPGMTFQSPWANQMWVGISYYKLCELG